MNPHRRPLRISAFVELVSLAVLLINMTTVDIQGIAALTGPVHGCAWLFGIFAALRDPRGNPPTTVVAVIPGIGGVLALRRLTRTDTDTGTDTDTETDVVVGREPRGDERLTTR
jgi:hypothetical protein